MNYYQAIQSIEPADIKSRSLAAARWNHIAKPLHSLGLLEDAIIKIAGIKRTPSFSLGNKALIIMCADNGVVAEGITQTGSEVTAIVAENFTKSNTSVNAMARSAGIHIYPVDMGINRDISNTCMNLFENAQELCTYGKNSIFPPQENIRILNRKISYGTKNMVDGPAMTKEQAVTAIETGMDIVLQLKEKGYQILATGEMGIGNTTTSSAVVSVLLEKAPETVTGRGAGLSTEDLERKVGVIAKSIERNHPNPSDPIDVISKVGGYDIAGLVGVFLGGAIQKIPIIIDGFISAAAALAAVLINPLTVDYLIASHISKEPAGRLLLETLKLAPFLDCGMCLGEGTGAVAALPIIEMALAVYHDMSTFEQNKIESYLEL